MIARDRFAAFGRFPSLDKARAHILDGADVDVDLVVGYAAYRRSNPFVILTAAPLQTLHQ